MVFVGGLRADEAFELQTGGGHRGVHEIGGFFLAVEFTGVSEGRDVEEILGKAGGLVVAPEELLPSGARLPTGGMGFGEEGRLGETGTGGGSAPEAGEVGGEVPRAAAAHGKTGDRDAEWVDGILGADGGEGFHHVDFAGELGRVAEATVGNERDDAFGGELGRAGFALGEEGELGAFFAAAEEPDHHGRGF